MFAARNMMIAGGAFTPLSLSPSLWLDASDASTLYDATSGGSLVAADGGVARWEDKSGNARHATQATSGNRPLRKTAIQNGKDVCRFDGSNDVLKYATASALLQNVSGATLFCVRKWTTSPVTGKLVFGVFINGSTGATRSLLAGGLTANKPYIGGRRLDADSIATATAAASVSTAAFQLQCAVLNYANSDAYQYINAALDGSNTSFQTNGNTSNTQSNGYAIAGTLADTLLADLDLAEILVFPTALSTPDRQAVETYLNAKWAIY